jgi:integrase
VGTTIIGENAESLTFRTGFAQNSGTPGCKMKFPVTIKHRRSQATIYAKSEKYPYYRLSYRAAGKRIIRSFATYAEAKEEGKKKVRELDAGNQAIALSPKEIADSLAIRDALTNFRVSTGHKITAVQAVTGYLDAVKLLPVGHNVADSVRGYLGTIAVVQRKPLAEAVAEFCQARELKAVALPGKRPALNPVYVADTARRLTEFGETFPGMSVADLAKKHLDAFVGAYSTLAPKSRNHLRATVTMFLGWCQRRDYLAHNHRLLEADSMRKEDADVGDVDYYRPAELRLLLDNAAPEMAVIIAMQAFGGLRLQEALRLDWNDVWRVAGSIEIASAKAKTRARRLVEINSTLAAWIKPHRKKEGMVTSLTLDAYTWQLIRLRKRLQIPSRKNGLRHGYLSGHYALHQNENQTAAIAGTSPAMLFRHYKGLMPKAQAKKWFAVRPAKAEGNAVPSPNQTGA